MRHITLLSIIAHLRPEALDAFNPHTFRTPHRGLLSALNPQPLPPEPPPEGLPVAAAQMAHELARLAIEAEIQGGSSAGFVSEFIDDWCGTPWPRKFPWPWPGPRPDEGPQPDPWDIRAARAVGALVFTSIGARLGESDLGNAFSDGAEKLAEVAVAG